jgi:hypothetical protein
MKEPARQARNQQRLTECFPAFAKLVRAVITDMEAQGFRPRIQDAFRTEAQQREDFEKGTSHVLFSFHNVTGAGGRKESLAVDLLDDDHPLKPTRRYLFLLAEAARARGLQTGILFDLKTAAQRKAVNDAIAARDFDSGVKIGFDPTHIEPTGITIAQARAGRRP